MRIARRAPVQAEFRSPPPDWQGRILSLLYNLLLTLILPWLWLRLFVKSVREPAYRQRIGERFGLVPDALAAHGGCIWFHTVSAGETVAAAPVIQALRERLPGRMFLVTTMTPAGSARVQELLGDTVAHCYAPYDYAWAVRRFLRRANPRALVLMETELWPNLVRLTAAGGAGVFLVNARLSEASFRGYRHVAALFRPVLQQLDQVVCQYEDTASRFRALGATRTLVTGSVKFDAELTADRYGVNSLALGAPAWIAGSTHDGEESVVLDAHVALRQRFPELQLILAPRHTSRVAAVVAEVESRGLPVVVLSVLRPLDECVGTDVAVIVVDVMGLLPHLYAKAHVAFVGGSLDDTGGHNPIEAALHGVPIMMGPKRFKIEEIWRRFADAGCAHEVSDAQDIAAVVLGLLEDPARRTSEGEAAKQVVARNRGARAAVVDMLAEWLA